MLAVAELQGRWSGKVGTPATWPHSFWAMYGRVQSRQRPGRKGPRPRLVTTLPPTPLRPLGLLIQTDRGYSGESDRLSKSAGPEAA